MWQKSEGVSAVSQQHKNQTYSVHLRPQSPEKAACGEGLGGLWRGKDPQGCETQHLEGRAIYGYDQISTLLVGNILGLHVILTF